MQRNHRQHQVDTIEQWHDLIGTARLNSGERGPDLQSCRPRRVSIRNEHGGDWKGGLDHGAHRPRTLYTPTAQGRAQRKRCECAHGRKTEPEAPAERPPQQNAIPEPRRRSPAFFDTDSARGLLMPMRSQYQGKMAVWLWKKSAPLQCQPVQAPVRRVALGQEASSQQGDERANGTGQPPTLTDDRRQPRQPSNEPAHRFEQPRDCLTQPHHWYDPLAPRAYAQQPADTSPL